MARDETLEQEMESTLRAMGIIAASGQIAAVLAGVAQEYQRENPKPETVTPTQGSMNSEGHTAFILRIFMYLVARAPNKRLVVNLEDVKALTGDHTLDIKLDGPMFSAVAIQHLVDPKGRMI